MLNIAVFADVQNIYYTTKQAYGRQFNYRKVWSLISEWGNIRYAYAYATHRGDDGQHKFQSALKHLGFEVKLKPFIQRSDGSRKGDWDVGIAIDVMEFAPQSDVVVLASGDGDFDILIKKIKNKFNTDSEVYGVPKLTAASLKAEATTFKPINEKLLLC